MEQLILDIAAIIAMSTPLLLATLGILISERAGVINLSVDGSMLLAGMVGFAVSLYTQNVIAGFVAAAIVGAAVAALVGYLGITLHMSQTAVGFVLALLCTDLSSFLGNPFVQQSGPAVPAWPIPVLADIPVIGTILFRHDPLIYAGLLILPLTAVLIQRTRAGLLLRGVGERPEALYARGVNVVRVRYLAVIIGGALIGLAGAAYTLDLKQGWTYRHTAGVGWIALAIVIFGAWKPFRVALGCYLYAALLTIASRMQGSWDIPTQVLQVAPFVVMILVLAVVNSLSNPRLANWIVSLPVPVQRVFAFFTSPAPASLGKPFRTS